ncbi:MAG TPA: TldD/PmbA family protein, partial [Thermoleophilia bacterium]
MRSFIAACLDAALAAGATYADVRVVDTVTQGVSVRNGVVEGVESSSSFGFGVRVIADGAWGFASSSDVTEASAAHVACNAVAIAKASTMAMGPDPLVLSDVAAYDGSWAGPCEIDPFTVSLDDKLTVLMAADAALRAESAVKLSECAMGFLKVTKTFGSTVGSYIEQSYFESSAGITGYAIADGEVLSRSYPNSHGGGCFQGGWETIAALDLPGNAPRVAAEAAALLTAIECPDTTTTVIIDASQLALQVHESVGHPTELDRVLGDEAAFAGTSWVGPKDIGRLRYGADIVNITADATIPGSLGSFGWDDEGVPAQRDDIVR